MEEKKISLGAMIDEFVGQTTEPAVPTEVRFKFGFEETKRANVALKNMGDDERIEFLKNLLELWNNAFYNASDREKSLEELHKIFGDEMDDWIGLRLMYTLTADGKQFRCWYGKPGRITSSHVDSCGEGDLFEVVGAWENVNKYVNVLLSERQKEKVVELPNGVKIWGFDWDWN